MEGTEMKILAVTLISLSLFASVASHAQTSTTKAPTSSLIKIVRSDSLQSNKGSAQYFTGSVQVQQRFLLTIHRAPVAGTLRSRPARGAPGIRTRSVKS